MNIRSSREEAMAGAAMQATEELSGTQYLTLFLGEEVFALDIGRVREVLDYTIITRVPRMPAYVQGVINLRGSVVPVIDLRLLFGMAAADVTVNTCIIIVEVSVSGDGVVLGLLADSVEEVVELGHGSIQPASRIGMRLDTHFIRGIGRQDGRFIILLDIDRVFSQNEIGLVQDMRDATASAAQPAA